MRKLFGVVAALLVVAGSAGAQVPWVDAFGAVKHNGLTTTQCSFTDSPNTATCTLDGVTGVVNAHATFGSATVSGALFGSPTNGGTYTAGGSAVAVDGVSVTGPVVPSTIVFYAMVESSGSVPGTFTGGVGGDNNAWGWSSNGITDGIGGVAVPYVGGNLNFWTHAYGNQAVVGGTASITTTIIGIDALDANGASVVGADDFAFLSGTNGSYFLGRPSTAPEPSSLALVGTGLLGVFPMYRRRRRA